MRIKFDNDLSSVKQNNYVTKIVNAYIVYYLDAWPKDPTCNFRFKYCLLVATFHDAVSWSFGNDFARNFIIFGVDNSYFSPTDNRKNNFFVLCGGLTFGINGSFGSPKKKFSINVSKANSKFCLSLHYIEHNSYLFVNRKDLRPTINMLTFRLDFV